MDVKSLIKERKIISLLESLESIRNELINITLPLKRSFNEKGMEKKILKSFNEKGMEKKALLNKVNELTIEVGTIIASINERKDVESIKVFTKRVREIVEEKEKIESLLLNFKDQA